MAVSLFRLLFFLLLLTPFAGVASGQLATFKVYGLQEGLDNLNVRALLQDARGFVWVGTENGLYRYDGSQFERFAVGDASQAVTVYALWQQDGVVWAGTDSGLFRERGLGFEPVQADAQPLRIGRTGVLALVDSEHFAYVSSSKLFLYSFAPLARTWKAEPYPHLPAVLNGAAVSAITRQQDGTLWIASDKGVAALAVDGKARWFPVTAPSAWRSIFVAGDGTVWLRSKSQVERIRLKSGSVEDVSNLGGAAAGEAFEGAQSSEFTQDTQGRILTALNRGLARWEGDRWRVFGTASGLLEAPVQSVLRDREGNLWLGYFGHGLVRWRGYGEWVSWTTASGMSDDLIWGMALDRQNQLWVATHHGVDVLHRDTGKVTAFDGLGKTASEFRAVVRSTDGSLWFGGAEETAVRLDPESHKTQRFTLPAQVFNLYAGRDGRVWLATVKGLWFAERQDGVWQVYTVTDAAIAGQRLYEVAESPNGELWASGDAGMFHYDLHQWQLLDTSLGKWGEGFSNVESVKNGEIWMTGAFRGVVRARIVGNRMTSFEQFTEPELVSDRVVQLRGDARGRMWVATDTGVSVYRESAGDGPVWQSYTVRDGLIWDDCDSFGLLADPDGSLWIGTSGGLSHFLSQRVERTPPLAPVLVSVHLGSRLLGLKAEGGVQLPFSRQPLSLHVAALDFGREEAITYRYRLQGLQSEWNSSNSGDVSLGSLVPGQYHVEVEALDTQSGRISEPLIVELWIRARWWQSTWFRILLLAAALALVAAVFLWRDSIQKRRNRTLERLVDERTEQLQQEATELRRVREELTVQATRDSLTGLWNRRVCLEKLDWELERLHRDDATMSVVLLDLDHFKQINDTHGHLAGDAVLKEVGSRLQSLLRPYDTLGRYGGEELLLLLPGLDAEQSLERVEGLRRKICEQPIDFGGISVRVTASFGICVIRAKNVPQKQVLHLADEALYKAKEAGRNRMEVVVFPEATGGKLS